MKIFDIDEGKIKVNENCLLIPELKAIVDTYENPIPALSYVYYMTSPDSPYHNLSQEDKINVISEDVGGDFGFDDTVIENALEKLHKLYETPIQEYYEGQKNAMHMMGRFLKNLTENSIEHGKDGNLSEIFRMQKEAGKVMESFLKLDKLWKEQVQDKLRGNAELGEY